jgi:hypothetical protein
MGGPRSQAGDEEEMVFFRDDEQKVLLLEALRSVWCGRAERSGRGRGGSGFLLLQLRGRRKIGGGRGPRCQTGDEEKLYGFFSCGGSGSRGGVGGPRCQTGDEEELVGSSGGASPPTGVGVATNCYDERNKGDRKGKEEKRVIDSESGRTSYLYSPLLPC